MLVDHAFWLSQASAYQWRLSLGPTKKFDHLSFWDTRKFEALFGDVGLSQSLPPVLRYQSEATNYLAAFGSLATFSVQSRLALPDSVKRLMKIGLDRQSREDFFGPHGSLSVSSAGKSLADSELIVRGVNDDLSAWNGVSAQHGDSHALSTEMSSLPPNPDGRRRIVDVSEGTPLDPLLNTTYDLNYPKVVPSMKDLSRYPSK